MILDVIIPTHNRHLLLRRTLDSIVKAEVPSGLHIRVTVIDNNSIDATPITVEAYSREFPHELNYVFESRQGRSFALNAGIASTNGDLIGMIDDDEEIDRSWLTTIYSLFGNSAIDFMGGPYVPRWGAERPDWLPMNYLGAIGWIDGGKNTVPFDKTYPGILMGGNAVLTREILNKVGPYNVNLGRNGTRLLAGEDDDMYRRLLGAGARGLYVPALIIYHYIPPERLLKNYFRRWCFWRGVSSGVIDRELRLPVAYLAGLPRYLYGGAARGIRQVAAGLFTTKHSSRTFSGELAVWDLVGFFYGKHFYKAPRAMRLAKGGPSNRNVSPSALDESGINSLAHD